MQLLLIKYGLVAVFVAAMLEADVIPVLAGVAAHRGYFSPPVALAAATFGALAGDCIWFYIGRSNLIRNTRLMQRLKSKAEILFQRVGKADTRFTRCLRNARCHDDIPGSARLSHRQIRVG